MFALAAFVPHSQLLQNVSGCRIVLKVRRKNPVQPEILKSVTNYFARSLSRVALSPEGNSQPVAQLGMLMLQLKAQANPADLSPICPERDGQPQLVRLFRKFEKSPRVLFCVRMRNAQRRGCDLARADQRQQFRNIFLAVRTNPQPLGFERRRASHVQSARASAIPAKAPARQSRLLPTTFASISPHWPCSKNDMLSNA